MFKSDLKQEIQTLQIAQVETNRPIEIQQNNLGGLFGTSLLIATGIFGTLLTAWFLQSCLCICKPNEVLVISGRKRKTKDGQEVGYRVLSGGRAIRIPIVEKVRRMDVTIMPVPVEVKNAYSKGGTPLNIQAIANVKLSSNPNIIGNAIERFLKSERKEILRVARETLEGNLRGVVATLTPEQVNEDRLQFAESITSDVSRDLMKLGLQIDTLKIQSVSDDVDYLSSIGRKRIAMIVRDAEIAESNAIREAESIESQCQQEAEVAKTQNRITILEKENELREVKAKLEQQARSEEEITTATVQEKQAFFEQKLQQLRAELERLRLEADQVLPAKAQQQAKELHAKGNAAIIAENAKAAALVNEMLAQVWQETDTDVSELFLIQQLETILNEAVEIPKRLYLDKISVVDNGDGKSLASLVKVYPEILNQYLESINQTLGIDVIGTLSGKKGKSEELGVRS